MIFSKSKTSNSTNRAFTVSLMKWHEQDNTRSYPWRGEKNPYLIWLSEIMLQQTRSEQGLPYYLKFKKHYPKITDLADAPLDKVLRDWQGLGYYSRARNLHQTARHITKELKGVFPDTYDTIIKLKGVGEYTAAAIASFAYNEPKAVVDGNVIRVLSRIFGIETAFDTTEGKKKFRELAQELLDKKNPASYNQAIMDFGASVCTPKANCTDCFFSKKCVAFNHNLISELPVKSKKITIKHRYFYYFILKEKNKIAICQRTGKDIWQGLWELPMIELPKPDLKNIEKQLAEQIDVIYEHNQTLSHQKIHSFFIPIKKIPQNSKVQFINIKELNKYAFPKTIHLFFSEKGLL